MVQHIKLLPRPDPHSSFYPMKGIKS